MGGRTRTFADRFLYSLVDFFYVYTVHYHTRGDGLLRALPTRPNAEPNAEPNAIADGSHASADGPNARADVSAD